MLATSFFVIFAALSIAAAIGVIISRKPVHSALFLLANFATLAVLYVTLEAQFLAAIQVIIYAGGIVILILFVIMLIGSEEIPTPESGGTRQWTAYLGIVLGVVLLGSIAGMLFGVFGEDEIANSVLQGGVPEVVGRALFTEYILPFELTAVLILVALLGALVLARRSQVANKAANK
ncbi:MAG: NADH-quinone oxidoreductase subunit J [Chloroflexota bacterium]